MKLLLFDIDGTLVDCGGAGSRSLESTFAEMFGVQNAFEGISMAGKTDPQIIRESLTKHGIAHNGLIPKLLDIYISNLESEIVKSDKSIMPGVREALDAVTSSSDKLLTGILTGNIEAGARIKLSAFGLDRYFKSGAFGSDDEDRNMLLPHAVKRFESIAGRCISYNNCIVIGDTPRDVECAKLHGARCIAVATGPYSYEELEKAGADLVFSTLEKTCALLDAVKSL